MVTPSSWIANHLLVYLRHSQHTEVQLVLHSRCLQFLIGLQAGGGGGGKKGENKHALLHHFINTHLYKLATASILLLLCDRSSHSGPSIYEDIRTWPSNLQSELLCCCKVCVGKNAVKVSVVVFSWWPVCTQTFTPTSCSFMQTGLAVTITPYYYTQCSTKQALRTLWQINGVAELYSSILYLF